MSRLIPNSTPAERAVGVNCSFAETMESAAKVIANGGTLYGTPTIDFGATLNGTTDYIKYNLQGHEFNSAEISIVIEFWPDTDTDENAIRYLFDSTAGARYSCYKDNNVGSNTLVVYLGNTLIAAIAEVTYSPYWNVGVRNVLQIRGTSGDTSVEMNGNTILANDATVWTAAAPTSLYVGSDNAGANLFKGKIGQFKVFNSLLTEQDAINYYDNSTYNYPDDALIHLPMRACDHDPDNVRTLDVSGKGNHATFGDGSTPTTYPTKLQKRGYSFGGGDYLNCGNPDNAKLSNFTKLSVFTFLVDNHIDLYTSIWSKGVYAQSAPFQDITFGTWSLTPRMFMSNGTTQTSKAGAGKIPTGTYASVSFTWDGTKNLNKLNMFINGVLDSSHTSDYNIGELQDTNSWGNQGYQSFNGELYYVLAVDLELTPLQIADLHIRMIKQVNHV